MKVTYENHGRRSFEQGRLAAWLAMHEVPVAIIATLAVLIAMLALAYALAFSLREDVLDACHRTNATRLTINQTALPQLNALLALEQRQGNLREFAQAQGVPTVDCEEAFPRPTPFG